MGASLALRRSVAPRRSGEGVVACPLGDHPASDQPQKKQRRRNTSPEADLQASMVRYLDIALPQPSPDYWWSATLNGVRLTSKRARAHAKAQGLRPGLFDLVFIKLTGPEAGQTYHFEVKSKEGALTPEQKVVMDALSPAMRGAMGRSLEALCATLIAWDFPIRARV
ncbi:MAG: hypothetical protein ACOVMT_04180 [Caulobacter sp.]